MVVVTGEQDTREFQEIQVPPAEPVDKILQLDSITAIIVREILDTAATMAMAAIILIISVVLEAHGPWATPTRSTMI